jgi:hypothetical protein
MGSAATQTKYGLRTRCRPAVVMVAVGLFCLGLLSTTSVAAGAISTSVPGHSVGVADSPTGFSTTPSSLAGGGYENTIAQDPNSTSELAVGGDVNGVELSSDGGNTWVPTNQGLLATSSGVAVERHVASLAFDSSDNLWATMGNGTAGDGEIWELTSAQIAGSNPVWVQKATAASFTVDGTQGSGAGWTYPKRPTGNLFGFSGSKVYLATEEGLVSDLSGTWSVTTPSSFWPSGDSGKIIATGFAVDPADNSYGLMTAEKTITGSPSTQGLFVIQGLGTTTPSVDCQKYPSGDTASDPAQEVVAISEHTNSPQYAAYVAFGTDGLVRFNLPSGTTDPCSGGSFYSTTPLVAAKSGSTDCYSDGFNAVAAVTTATGAEIWGGCGSTANSGTALMPYNDELWRVAINDATGTITSEGLNGSGGSDQATLSDDYPYGASNVPWWHIAPAAPPDPPNVTTPKDELGNSLYVTSQIVLQAGHANVWVAGRSGVWTTNDGTASAMSGITFNPDVDGLTSTYDFAVAGSPSTTSPDVKNAAVADHDWEVLLSQNRLLTSTTSSYAAYNQRPDSTNNTEQAVGYLPVSSGDAPLLVGDAAGVVSYNPAPEASGTSCTTGNCWVNLPALPGATPVFAVTAGYDGAGDVSILAAGAYVSSSEAGVYVMDCASTTIASCASGTWSSGITSGNANELFGNVLSGQKSMSFYWAPSTSGGVNAGQDVYLYDGSTGLWGSETHGDAASWTSLDVNTKVMPGSSIGETPGPQQQFAGFMAGTHTTKDILYVTNGASLFEYNDAKSCFTTCGTGNPTGALAFNSSTNRAPGPVQIDTDGDVFVADTSFDSGVGNSALYELPSGSSTWSSVGDTAFKESVLAPNSMGISADSCPYLYFASQGQGVDVATGRGC